MTLTPTLSDLVDVAARSAVDELRGPVLGSVVAYDPAAQLATVRPVLAVLVEGAPVPAPTLQGVPVAWPRWASGADTWPIAPGALVVLLPLDGDHSLTLQAGSTDQPAATLRRWSLSDCVAVPLWPSPQSAPLAATAYHASGRVIAGPVYLGASTATDFVALASKVLTELQAITNWALAHVHTCAAPGAPSSVPTVPPTAPSSVASTNTRST